MNDPWPRFKSFVFCTMIFVVFGTLLSWAEIRSGDIKGIDEPIGKVIFVLAVLAIALILLVHELDLKWIARISIIICCCLFYYILTLSFRYDIKTSTLYEGMKVLGEGIYFTLVSSFLSILISLFGSRAHKC